MLVKELMKMLHPEANIRVELVDVSQDIIDKPEAVAKRFGDRKMYDWYASDLMKQKNSDLKYHFEVFI